MQLPFLKSHEPQKNFFLSLLIKPFKVGAILFEEINSKLFILSTNEISTGGQTSELSDEELLLSADKVISFVEGSLPEGSTVEKTIFSVPYDWVDVGKIKKDYLVKLKKVCEGLGLVPMGYLMSIEAVVHFLEQSEGAPVSAIFVEVSENKVFVYLVRAGKILEVQDGLIEKNVLQSSVSLLKKIESVDVLPSKIILLDYKGVEGIQQEFLSYNFPKEIPFLHIPQVMVLEKGFENEATVNGVASQMDLEVFADVRAEQNLPSSEELLEETDAKTFGFVKERDVAVEKTEKEEETDRKGPAREEIGKDTEQPSIKYFKKEGDEDQDQNENTKNDTDFEKKLPSALPISNFLSILTEIKVPNFNRIRSLAFLGGSRSLKTKLIVFGIGFLLFIFLLSFIYYNLILRAQITIFADKKAIDKTADVTFQENAKAGESINLVLLEEKVNGQDTKNSTGKKETGDKARGELTLYNKTDQKKTFSKGTIVISPNDLEFELESEVNIASTSPFSTTLSSAKSKVLAAKFGKEYNLPSSSNFTLKGLSSANFIAKNIDAITGGTKKETTIVSKTDLQDLLDSVVEKLEKDAISNAARQANSDESIFPKALSFAVSEEKYSKKEGEESGSVGIEATIEFIVGKYKKQDIQKVVESVSEGEVPGTYALLEGESKVGIANIKVDQKNKSASAKLAVNAIYTPKIESLKLAEALRGKNSEEAGRQIEKIVGVTEVLINLRSRLPFFPKNLPQNSKNILIEIKN